VAVFHMYVGAEVTQHGAVRCVVAGKTTQLQSGRQERNLVYCNVHAVTREEGLIPECFGRYENKHLTSKFRYKRKIVIEGSIFVSVAE